MVGREGVVVRSGKGAHVLRCQGLAYWVAVTAFSNDVPPVVSDT